MSVTLVFVFAILITAGFFALQQKEKRKEKRESEESADPLWELALLKTALQVERAERHRVANALHYKSSSTIAAVKMYLNAVHATNDETYLKASFGKVHTLLDSAYVEINKSLYSLMPEMAMENGLEEAVRRYCSHLTTHKLLTVEYDSWGTARRYHEAYELSVFRVVQMLVNYILQHGKATFAVVQIGIRPTNLSIAVEDNGTGYKSLPELMEEPFFIHLTTSIRAINGQVELGADNGLSAFVQLDTTTFEIAEQLPVLVAESAFQGNC
jgi:signal transduction histidine kinase